MAKSESVGVKRAIVLDIDNTLTPPRRALEAEMAHALRHLTVPFFLAAGSDLSLVEKQFVDPLHRFGFRGSFDAFLCNGSIRYRFELGADVSIQLMRNFSLRSYLGEQRFQELLRVIESTLDSEEFRLPPPMRILGDRIVDRISMINVAPIGRPEGSLNEQEYANRDAFQEYDKRTGFRGRFLKHLTTEVADLVEAGLHISLGGQTSFDIVIRGNDKSYALQSLLDEGFEQIWYIGDALFEGGNDEAVLNFIEDWNRTNPCPVEAIRVDNWRQTMRALYDLGILNGACPKALPSSTGAFMVIRAIEREIKPDSDTFEDLHLSDEIVRVYGLERWAKRFSLMTAGYRDHIDPNDAANPEVPFNIITVALMAEAKGRVLSRKLKDGTPADVHIGGEVRAHTQTFIQIASRIYAAQGFRVHLRKEVPTSPIWYSSFGVFYEEYQSGDNFTASHSPYFKLGWKVLDREGKELTEEEEEIIQEIRRMVAERSTIHLAPWHSSGRIFWDLDIDEAYSEYQRSALGNEVFGTIVNAANAGFRCAASPLGGSMGATSKRLLRCLGIPDHAISFFLDSEDWRFHRVGEIGEHNLGADVGKSEVCARTGAPQKLLTHEADLILLWDPDGDRLNVMSTAPIGFREKAIEFGLKLGPDNGERVIVYLTPNQLYVLLIHYRVNLLRRLGLLDRHDWFVVTTFPSAMAIEELASKEGLPTIRVPVGFRNLGDACRNIETKLGVEQTVTTLTGRHIKLGPSPRALLLCEESGGATLGGPDLLKSKNGKQTMLSLREKDGLQLSLLAWAMAASLHGSGVSIAEQYCNILSERQIQYRYGARLDVSLYNESLTGTELKAAKAEGVRKRDQAVSFFRDIATNFSSGTRRESDIRNSLREANPRAAAAALSTIKGAAWIGDGSLFEMDSSRLIVRASGTDALIRYYVEATSRERLIALQEFISGLNF